MLYNANNTVKIMPENPQPPAIEKTYYTYRSYSGKIFRSELEIPYAEKISKCKEILETKQSP